MAAPPRPSAAAVGSRAGSSSSPPAPAGADGPQRAKSAPAKKVAVRPEDARTPEDFVQVAIQFHEQNRLEASLAWLRRAAEADSPIGTLLYGIALRHGWGCEPNEQLAFQYLQKAAEKAVTDLNSGLNVVDSSAARQELVMAIYELGVCFRHGWGVVKNKVTAVYYFEIAAELGDPDAQNDLAACYEHADGVKKDRMKAATLYRKAAAQGHDLLGNSWIWKPKYDPQK